MMKFFFIQCVFLAALFISRTVVAQPIPIFLDITVDNNDSAGMQLSYEIKESIRASSGFHLVEMENSWPYIRHAIVMLRNGTGTVVSHTITYDDINMPLDGALITSVVQICGASAIRACAQRMMGRIDNAVDILKKRSPSLWSNLKNPSTTRTRPASPARPSF